MAFKNMDHKSFRPAESGGEVAYKTEHDFDSKTDDPGFNSEAQGKAEGGEIECPRCGHSFNGKGYATGGLVEGPEFHDDSYKPMDEDFEAEDRRTDFAKALMSNRRTKY